MESSLVGSCFGHHGHHVLNVTILNMLVLMRTFVVHVELSGHLIGGWMNANVVILKRTTTVIEIKYE